MLDFMCVFVSAENLFASVSRVIALCSFLLTELM